MLKKLIQKFKVEIKIVKVEDSIKPTQSDYSKLKGCTKCNCPLFPGEIMCPDCLTPIM